jgi:hypothetical protein
VSPRVRRLALTAHVTVSVGWLGAVLAYLALALSGLSSPDARTASVAYPAMALIGERVIVPLAVASLATGLIQALGTEWGLLRHYWVLTKLLLTVVGTLVLLLPMPAVTHVAALVASGVDPGPARLPLVVHPAGGLAILLAATALSVHKPWGRTVRGTRA